MLEALQLPFMQRALIAGVLVGAIASYLGVFIVQRRLSFLGDGLAHAAFAGVALGLLLGTQPVYVAVPFAVAVALAITWVRERSSLGEDTTIGIFFAFSVALGVLFMSMRRGYTADALSYIFGSILTVTWPELWAVVVLAALTLLLLPLWGRWAYATFERELALADRLPVLRQDYLMAALIAVVTVMSVKVVGIVLIAAFLVIPAAASRLLSPTFAHMTVRAVLIGVATSLLGLFLSYHLDTPSGATIVLIQVALFLLALLLRQK
jgi:zinc transport system permease protein